MIRKQFKISENADFCRDVLKNCEILRRFQKNIQENLLFLKTKIAWPKNNRKPKMEENMKRENSPTERDRKIRLLLIWQQLKKTRRLWVLSQFLRPTLYHHLHHCMKTCLAQGTALLQGQPRVNVPVFSFFFLNNSGPASPRRPLCARSGANYRFASLRKVSLK